MSFGMFSKQKKLKGKIGLVRYGSSKSLQKTMNGFLKKLRLYQYAKFG